METNFDDGTQLQVLNEIIIRELEKYDIEKLMRDRNLLNQDADELLPIEILDSDFRGAEATRPKGRLAQELVSNQEIQEVLEEVKNRVLSQMSLKGGKPSSSQEPYGKACTFLGFSLN